MGDRVREASILDIPTIIGILKETYDNMENQELLISFRLKLPDFFTYYIDETEGAILILERIGNYKAQFHIYTRSTFKRNKIKKFIKGVIPLAFKRHNYTSFLTFAPEDNKPAIMLARIMGCENHGLVKEAGGSGKHEYLFSTTRSKLGGIK